MTLPPLRPGKHVSEACHRLSHINFRADVTGVTELSRKTSKAALNGRLLPLRSPPRLWFAWSVFWWYPHPGWANDDKVLSEPAEHFIYLFFPYGDELLLTAQRLVQHIAKCKRSDRKWGLTLSRAGSHPSRGRPPVAVCNKAARLLLLAAVFHHWIAHRCCQNSRPCVQFVFSPPLPLYPWIQWEWLCLSWTMNWCPSGCLFIYPSLKYLRHPARSGLINWDVNVGASSD